MDRFLRCRVQFWVVSMKWLTILMGIVILSMAIFGFMAQARCDYCPSFKCLSGDICGDCACIQTGQEYGYCASITY